MTKDDALIRPDRGEDATTIYLVTAADYGVWLKTLAPGQRAALGAQQFDASEGKIAVVPDGDNWFAVAGVTKGDAQSAWALAPLAERLPAGTYRLSDGAYGDAFTGPAALFGWQSAQYRYDRYRRSDDHSDIGPRILLTSHANAIAPIQAEVAATNLVCDLVNCPAEDMGPAALEDIVQNLAKTHGASLNVTRGDMLEQDYPMVHAVGRAAARSHAPRMLHLEWGDPANPSVAIVGKGVCFDSGGLDIKSASGMRIMKKDMGGAAHAIALASLIMEHNLPVKLHLLVPAVENAVAGNAFRPGDILRSRKGLSVEIGNTDAEGRLILADALTRASEEQPDLIIDFATLTGAARVALGPDLPALMARSDATANALISAGLTFDDPVWRMPLHGAYNEWLQSDIADIGNAHGNAYAGAIVAGLFLDSFVAEGLDWAHFDTFAWRPSARPGRPKGGAAYGLRASWHMLKERFNG